MSHAYISMLASLSQLPHHKNLSASLEISLSCQTIYQYLLDNPVSGPSFVPTVIATLHPSNTPLTNIVIMSPIHFISHCPLEQHICVFMHWGHDYHSMFPLHLLFAEARKGYYLRTELMARGNPLSKRILQILCH